MNCGNGIARPRSAHPTARRASAHTVFPHWNRVAGAMRTFGRVCTAALPYVHAGRLANRQVAGRHAVDVRLLGVGSRVRCSLSTPGLPLAEPVVYSTHSMYVYVRQYVFRVVSVLQDFVYDNCYAMMMDDETWLVERALDRLAQATCAPTRRDKSAAILRGSRALVSLTRRARLLCEFDCPPLPLSRARPLPLTRSPRSRSCGSSSWRSQLRKSLTRRRRSRLEV